MGGGQNTDFSHKPFSSPCVSPGSEFALTLLEHPEEGGSVLTKASMDAFWALDATIVGIEVSQARNNPVLRSAYTIRRENS